MVQFSTADWGRGSTQVPSSLPVKVSKKNTLLLRSGSSASHAGSSPPPGSQPMTVTRPSQLSAAECQPVTPWGGEARDEPGPGRVADVVHGGHVAGADGQAPVAVQQHP